MMDKLAFPQPPEWVLSEQNCGLTRRELFAAMVMPTFLRLAFSGNIELPDGSDPMHAEIEIAKAAVGVADALIAELDREEK